jgi:hypothetical protein
MIEDKRRGGSGELVMIHKDDNGTMINDAGRRRGREVLLRRRLAN